MQRTPVGRCSRWRGGAIALRPALLAPLPGGFSSLPKPPCQQIERQKPPCRLRVKGSRFIGSREAKAADRLCGINKELITWLWWELFRIFSDPCCSYARCLLFSEPSCRLLDWGVLANSPSAFQLVDGIWLFQLHGHRRRLVSRTRIVATPCQ